MVCRDNFFNVKYAIDMAELTESYIKGFVETCFKAGVHEKQAAAMLDLAAESSAMEKSASPSVWKGIKQLFSGTGNIVGGLGHGIFSGGKTIFSPIGKGIRWGNDKYMVQPIKHYSKNKDFLAAFTHAGLYGGLPPVLGLTAFQNWRANSDSGLADAINDYLGDPEFLVLGKGTGGRGSGVSTAVTSTAPAYRPSYNDSPLNIPGTTSYTPGEAQLIGAGSGGTATSSGVVIPERIVPILNERREVARSLNAMRNNASSSRSAARRARTGQSDAERQAVERLRMLDDQWREGVAEHNKQVAINNRDLSRRVAEAEEAYSNAVRRDKYQSGVGVQRPDGFIDDATNSTLEFIGVRDSEEDLLRRERDLIAKDRAVRDLRRIRPEAPVDAGKIQTHVENAYGGRFN